MANEEAAQEHFSNAVVASLSGSQTETAIAEYEMALSLGLPEEKEVLAHPYARVRSGRV
jgi:hypothetical protein